MGVAPSARADVQVGGQIVEQYTIPSQQTVLDSYGANFPGAIQRGVRVDHNAIFNDDLGYHALASSGGGPGYVNSAAFVQHLRQESSGGVGAYSLTATASADAQWTDMVVSGPAGGPSMVPFTVNVAIDGSALLQTGGVVDPNGVGYSVDASANFGLVVNDAVAINGSNWFINSDNGGPIYYPPADGIFVNFNGSVHATSAIVMVPVNTPFTIRMFLQTRANFRAPAGQAGILASNIDFAHTASFDTTTATPFGVPEGYTVNSASASVVNNTYSVPAPGAMMMLASAGLIATRRRR